MSVSECVVVLSQQQQEAKSEPGRAGGSLSFISNNFSPTNKARLGLGLCFNLTVFTHLPSRISLSSSGLLSGPRLLPFIAPFLLPIGSLFAPYLLPICFLFASYLLTL